MLGWETCWYRGPPVKWFSVVCHKFACTSKTFSVCSALNLLLELLSWYFYFNRSESESALTYVYLWQSAYRTLTLFSLEAFSSTVPKVCDWLRCNWRCNEVSSTAEREKKMPATLHHIRRYPISQGGNRIPTVVGDSTLKLILWRRLFTSQSNTRDKKQRRAKVVVDRVAHARCDKLRCSREKNSVVVRRSILLPQRLFLVTEH